MAGRWGEPVELERSAWEHVQNQLATINEEDVENARVIESVLEIEDTLFTKEELETGKIGILMQLFRLMGMGSSTPSLLDRMICVDHICHIIAIEGE